MPQAKPTGVALHNAVAEGDIRKGDPRRYRRALVQGAGWVIVAFYLRACGKGNRRT